MFPCRSSFRYGLHYLIRAQFPGFICTALIPRMHVHYRFDVPCLHFSSASIPRLRIPHRSSKASLSLVFRRRHLAMLHNRSGCLMFEPQSLVGTSRRRVSSASLVIPPLPPPPSWHVSSTPWPPWPVSWKSLPRRRERGGAVSHRPGLGLFSRARARVPPSTSLPAPSLSLAGAP